MQEKIFIENSKGEKLAGVLHKANDNKQVVIICHGHTGNKDRDFINSFCDKLNNKNINSFRFDFSGNGESEGEYINTNSTSELNDLNSVVDYFKNLSYEIGLIGHSRGGMDVVLYSSKNKEIKFIITIGAPGKLSFIRRRLSEKQLKDVEEGKIILEFKQKDNKNFPISIEMIEDIESYKPLEEIKKVKIPKLFIVGTKDREITQKAAQEYYDEANNPKELKIFDNADHCFTDPKLLKEMITYCINWIKKIKVFD